MDLDLQPTTVHYMQLEEDSKQSTYRCCNSGYCHIKVWCVAVVILHLVFAVLVCVALVLIGCFAVHTDYDTLLAALIMPLIGLGQLAVISTCTLCLIGIRKRKSRLVTPQIVAQYCQMVIYSMAWFVYAFIYKNSLTLNAEALIYHNYGIDAHHKGWFILWLLTLVVPLGLYLSFEIWATYSLRQLRRYVQAQEELREDRRSNKLIVEEYDVVR